LSVLRSRNHNLASRCSPPMHQICTALFSRWGLYVSVRSRVTPRYFGQFTWVINVLSNFQLCPSENTNFSFWRIRTQTPLMKESAQCFKIYFKMDFAIIEHSCLVCQRDLRAAYWNKSMINWHDILLFNIYRTKEIGKFILHL
jgi:hypothetical protein